MPPGILPTSSVEVMQDDHEQHDVLELALHSSDAASTLEDSMHGDETFDLPSDHQSVSNHMTITHNVFKKFGTAVEPNQLFSKFFQRHGIV